MSCPDDLIVFGAGGHARVVLDTVFSMGLSVSGVIDIEYQGQQEEILGIPVIGGIEQFRSLNPNETSVLVAIGDRKIRSHYYHFLIGKGFSLPSIIHQSATLSEYSQIGKGSLINASSIINAGAVIGNNCIINSGAIIEHEVRIGDHSHIGPGVSIAGRTTIGENSIIGIGSCIIDKVKIGKNVVIGAGSVIISDVPEDTTWVGVPGRRVK